MTPGVHVVFMRFRVFRARVHAQVLEWTQTVLAAGEAFSGSESATLCDTLQRQSGRFFAAYHAANMQARAPRKQCSHVVHRLTNHVLPSFVAYRSSAFWLCRFQARLSVHWADKMSVKAEEDPEGIIEVLPEKRHPC